MSKLGLVSQTKAKTAKLEEEVSLLVKNVEVMITILIEQKNAVDKFTVNQVYQMTRPASPHGPSCDHLTTPITIKQAHGTNKRQSRKCMLIEWIEETLVVAKGRWVSSDFTTKVHCIPLGNRAPKIWVDEVEESSAKLLRVTSYMETIMDAKGTTVAWPTQCLLFNDE